MDLYMDFINDVVKLLRNSEEIKNILSIYLGGSLSRGDYKVGISDIDIYIVLKDPDNKTEIINSYIQEIAKRKLPILLSWCPDGVTVAFTHIQEIRSGQSWLGNGADYYTFIDTGKLIYGKDIKSEIVKPNEEDIFNISRQSISHLKQIVNQDITNIIFDKQFIRDVFGTAYSAMHFYLCLNRKYIRGKIDITNEFNKVNTSYSEQANKIYNLWNIFGQRELNEIEINNLVNLTKEIIMNL